LEEILDGMNPFALCFSSSKSNVGAPRVQLYRSYGHQRSKRSLYCSCSHLLSFRNWILLSGVLWLFGYLIYASLFGLLDRRKWSLADRGVNGLTADLELERVCPIKHLISPFDWLPLRALSFWKIPWCRDPTLFSTLQNGVLHVHGCQNGDVWYVLDPNFAKDPYGLRGDFMDRILPQYTRHHRARVFNYTRGERVRIDAEIVRVYCSDGRENYHIQNLFDEEIARNATVRRKHFEREAKKPSRESIKTVQSSFSKDDSFKASSPSKQQRISSQSSKRPLNVIILMYDSLSRAHFLRALPKTVSALERIDQDSRYELFQFFRYQVLGTNSLPNITPMFR